MTVPLTDLDRRILSYLVEGCRKTLGKLGSDKENGNLFDQTHNFTIADRLAQVGSGLAAIIAELDGDGNVTATATEIHTSKETDDGSQKIFFKYEEHEQLTEEVENLRKVLHSLKWQYHYLTEDLHIATQLEIARNRLVHRWEAARYEQLTVAIRLQTDELRERHRKQEHNIAQILKAAGKVEEFYGWKLTAVEREIDEWMERFDREKEQLDQRFQKARATEKLWNEMKETHRKRVEELIQLQQEVDRRLAESERKILRPQMAVKVQAWWRGLMVRKGLGRFGSGSKKKKKGKQKGKSKKKAKKK